MLARLVTLLLLLSTPVLAETVAIRAGHLVDPATGLVTDDQIVLVREGKIVEVGPSVKIPQGAEVVDLSNAWVFPGLMDAHTHLAMGLNERMENIGARRLYTILEHLLEDCDSSCSSL